MTRADSRELPPERLWLRERESTRIPIGTTTASHATRKKLTRRLTLKQTAVIVHRYVGLTTAVFLVVASSTGALLAFNRELDIWLNPKLTLSPPPTADARPLDPLALRALLTDSLPEASIEHVDLRHVPGEASVLFVTHPEGSAERLDTEYFVNPYSGEVQGSRRWGELGQGTKSIMPFVYRLHASLALGVVGEHLLGIIALLWTLDCFVGAYLTFPTTSPSSLRTSQPLLRRLLTQPSRWGLWVRSWSKSWALRTTKLFAFIFTWHRASGLWLWGMLLVFAWSSVGLNLDEVYSPVMRRVFATANVYEHLPRLTQPKVAPVIPWHEARNIGRELISVQATRDGFTVLEERRIGYFEERGLYRYSVRSTLDISSKYPNTTVWFDADTGRQVAFEAPTGGYLGDTVNTWLFHLHWGTVSQWGIAYRLWVAVLGVAIAVLSVTGVWIWWRKRAPAR